MKKRTRKVTKRATRKTVAQQANVSEAVVSFVLNGNARELRISEPTIERVKGVARKLGYKPNIWGRILKTNRSKLITLICGNIGDPLVGSVIDAFGKVAFKSEYTLSIFDAALAPASGGRSYLDALASLSDGLVLLSPTQDLLSRCMGCELLDKPVCAIGDVSLSLTAIPSVEMDNRLGGRLAGGHLASLELPSLGIISDSESLLYSKERNAGFLSILPEPIRNGVILHSRKEGESQFEVGRSAVKAWINAGSLPKGIFAHGDVIAMGALCELSKHGINCPKDVKVIGFDDVPFAEFSIPPLSSIRQPIELMCEACFKMLVQMIEGYEPDTPHASVSPTISVRESTSAK